jgi:hypothetical protein
VKEVFEQKMSKLEKAADKMAKKLHKRFEEQLIAESKDIDVTPEDEYYYSEIVQETGPFVEPEEEETANFGPELFPREIRVVTTKTPKKRDRKVVTEAATVIPEAKTMEATKESARVKKVHEALKQIHLEEKKSMLVGAEVPTFKFMSYSLMSDRMFEGSSKSHLAKDDQTHDSKYRRRRILREIQNSNCDVVCLQEVTNYKVDSYFFDKLRFIGYELVTQSASQPIMTK